MEIEVRIDSSRREQKVVIFTDRMTEEVDAIVKRLSGGQPQHAGCQAQLDQGGRTSEISGQFGQAREVEIGDERPESRQVAQNENESFFVHGPSGFLKKRVSEHIKAN